MYLVYGRNESAPSNKALKNWYTVVQENGSVENPKKQRGEMAPKTVSYEFNRDPKQSLRRASKKLKISYGSVQTVMKSSGYERCMAKGEFFCV